MKQLLLIIFIVFIFESCKTDLVFIQVKNPAPVTLTNDVKNIGVLNRSRSGDSTFLNILHTINSLELSEINKEGSSEALLGLKNRLTETGKFEQIKIVDEKIKSVNAVIFPAPLPWDEVEKICDHNNIDALFVLAVFDTDLKIMPINIPKDVSNPLAVISSIQQQINIITTITAGWRIYVPKQKLILDEYSIKNSITYRSNSINPLTTVEALIGRKDAIKQLANKMGYLYANRILPYSLRVSREYYVKGNTNFKIAKRKAQTGNWDDAALLWEKETKNNKRKIAGRAYYNMAIINEINGNTDIAIEWAQQAYEDYSNRLALKYVNILRDRKHQNKFLQMQQDLQ